MKNKLKILFSFIPLSTFMSTHFATTPDLSKIRVAITKNCSSLSNQSTGIFNVEVAKTIESRNLGLGGRHKPLAKDEGMLFLFEQPSRVSFWMKNTYIPLQIAYFNTDGRMTKIYDMKVEKNPMAPKKMYDSDSLTIAAIEVAPKTFSNKLIKSGAILCVEPLPEKTNDAKSAIIPAR